MIDIEREERVSEIPPTREWAKEVLTQIRQLLSEHFGVSPDDTRLHARFIEELEIEPLDVTDLILALEEAFDIDISNTEAESIRTVRDALLCVLSKREAPASERQGK